ncbi:GLI pathogenesis-related 2, like isoform X2 [Nerophis ophidion]|uniref:GLI pathogenesis-related 2, like isoform X2 n=1 Tax=Nerophis ophidion TaxID=159077 RepID=UPI002AE02BA5|nr:GLI pathogenesis-related 2, like isoform X2 [Nerophis ophidion]
MGKSASKQFAEEALRRHNELRKRHQAPPLKLSSKLNREAARYAESLASTRILKHSEDSSKGSYGENLAWASNDQLGHFTAMVWKSTTTLGVGKAIASDGSSFVVARYFPAGNITNQGHFESNVLPARGPGLTS